MWACRVGLGQNGAGVGQLLGEAPTDTQGPTLGRAQAWLVPGTQTGTPESEMPLSEA